MTETHFTTVSGKQVDLSAPTLEDIDFDDIAEHLAKEPRYNGATPHTVYFVAQHLVLGADWILASAAPDVPRRTEWLGALRAGKPGFYFEDTPWLPDANAETRLTAAYYLCHDFEEAYLKDDTTPKKRTIDQEVQTFGVAAGVFREALAKVVERFDAVIHAKAGLAWPMPKEIQRIVHDIDARMLATEWKALRPKHEFPREFAEPLPIKIEPWAWWSAHELLADRMAKLLPACRVKG